MRSVTAGGPGLVAVGSESLGFDADAAVWTSVDGVTWSRVPHDEAVFGGPNNQWMGSVTAGGPGLVAVGSDRSVGDGVAGVWTSVDGITWSRVPHDEAVFGGARGLEMLSVTAGGPGFVAVGQVGSSMIMDDPELGADAAVLTSVDGITWSRAPHDEAVFGEGVGFGGESFQGMNSVTAGGPGLVAVGFDGLDGSDDVDGPAVWTATTGD
jgi:hypothetical protein